MSLKRMCAGAAAALATTFIAPVAAQAFQPPTPQSFIHNCAPKQVVVVPGGANTNPFMPDRLPIGLITNDVGTQLGNRADTDVTYIPYQSYGFAATPYPQASADGYTKASHTIARIQNDCPHSKISLVGYSLGADISARIINDACRDIGTERIADKANLAMWTIILDTRNGMRRLGIAISRGLWVGRCSEAIGLIGDIGHISISTVAKLSTYVISNETNR